MQEQISISKFKASCLHLLQKVRKTGQNILVTRRGEPVALVVPPPPPKKASTWLGSMRNVIKITGDITSPVLTEDEWEILMK